MNVFIYHLVKIALGRCLAKNKLFQVLMSVYEAKEYKSYLKTWVETRPGGGRGEYRKMADSLAISTTMISQVVNGEKHFSMEVASELCDYLALSDREAEFFLLMVESERAGSVRYQQRLKKRLEALREQALKIEERYNTDRDLTEMEMARYYSSWVPTGLVHLLATDPKYDIDGLAQRLKLPREQVAKVMTLLLEAKIVVEKKGQFEIGVKRTYLPPDSPLVAKHHQNWRLQAFSKMNHQSDTDLFFTVPMSLSAETSAQIRKELRETIVKILDWVGPSPSEVVRCLNVDWFEY